MMIFKSSKIGLNLNAWDSFFSRFQAVGKSEPCNFTFTQPRTGAAHQHTQVQMQHAQKTLRHEAVWPRLSLMDKP